MRSSNLQDGSVGAQHAAPLLNRRISPWLDGLWLLGLMLYVLAGTALVPFHGDESTLVMMSRDYHDLFIQGDVSQVWYTDPPLNAERQHLRLINGTVAPYVIGLAWHTAGYTVDDLNSQWDWNADWNWNVTDGHRPSEGLLLAARWPMAILTALSVAAIFVLGRLLQGRPAAYAASLFLTLHPAVLVNGRRAMFEAPLLLFTLLVITLAVWWTRRLARSGEKPAVQRWIAAVGLAAASGLAVASKHNGLIPVAVSYLALAVIIPWQTRKWRTPEYFALIVSGLLALVVFLALNPAWWGDPMGRARQVLELRLSLANAHNDAYDSIVYPDMGARLAGMASQLSSAPTDYYEAHGWDALLAEPIRAYRESPWTGVQVGANPLTTLFGIGLFVLSLAGAGRSLFVLRAGNVPALVVILWTVLTVFTILSTISLPWQRYYMPIFPAEALLAGLGAGWLFRRFFGRHPEEAD